jgi:hypothetical protein
VLVAIQDKTPECATWTTFCDVFRAPEAKAMKIEVDETGFWAMDRIAGVSSKPAAKPAPKLSSAPMTKSQS